VDVAVVGVVDIVEVLVELGGAVTEGAEEKTGGEESVGESVGLPQNLTLPQLHVTKKCSRNCTSDTGSWCVLCSTSGCICGTSLRPLLSTSGALY